MQLFFNRISIYHEVIGCVSKYNLNLPPGAKRKLITWLVYQKFLHMPAQPSLGKQLPIIIKRRIEEQVSLFSGYMVLIAHDDAVDKYNLGTYHIYEQLSRCLAVFLIGLTCDVKEQITVGSLRSKLDQYASQLNIQLSSHPKIVAELHFLFDNPSLLRGISNNEPLTIPMLFFDNNEHELLCSDWLNMTIVSAFEMGKIFRNISELLQKYLAEDESVLQRRLEFLLALLVRCMYAQAHTSEQRNLDTLQYERFIELTYMKGNLISDIHGYILNQVYEQRFFATYCNSSRFCHQFFDDFQDLEEDTQAGVLGILHMQLVEQGRLAKKFLAMSEEQPVSIELVNELLKSTQVLRITFDKTYLHQNPYIRAERDSQGNLCMEPRNVETILKEIWVNSPNELEWSIDKLARHRFALYSAFNKAWQEKNNNRLIEIVHSSNIPMLFLRGFDYFWRQSRRIVIESHRIHNALITGYIFYYIVKLGSKIIQLQFWKESKLYFLKHS
jgi:hypothetical protein